MAEEKKRKADDTTMYSAFSPSPGKTAVDLGYENAPISRGIKSAIKKLDKEDEDEKDLRALKKALEDKSPEHVFRVGGPRLRSIVRDIIKSIAGDKDKKEKLSKPKKASGGKVYGSTTRKASYKGG